MQTDKLKTRAMNNAYALLRARPRSEAEFRQRLKLKGYKDDVVDSVIEELRRLGYVDDAKFAKLWIESRMHTNPVGDVILRHELKLKGVAASVIEEALAAKAEAYDEQNIAKSMAVEQFERFKKLDRRKALKRVYDFLLRRGFGYEAVRSVVEEIGSGDAE